MRQIDYTKFSADGKKLEQEAMINKRWWLAEKADRPASIAAIIKFLNQYDSKRESQNQTSVRLYGNVMLFGVTGASMSKQAVSGGAKERLTYNVVQSAVDTVVSKMAKNRPRPLFLTNGGDWKAQRKAKKLNKFVDGIFYENKADELSLDAFRDGAVVGDGFVYVFEEDNRVKFERVMASELTVDWVEAAYGHPRQLHRSKLVDKDVLIDLFPEKKDAIEAANSASAELTGEYQNVANQVLVHESWHLPSGKDAKDGLHTINLETVNLFEEPWTKNYFPFARFQWAKRYWGYWSQGGVEQIQNIQLEINKILWIIQRSMHLAGTFKVLLENGSKIVKEFINNDIGAIITYNGTKPEYIVPPIVPVEYYNHLANLKNSAFEQFGVSQLSAASQKPAGLDSGRALREFNDIESDRFMTIGQAYQNFRLQLAELAIDKAKDIAAREDGYKTKVPDGNFLSTIDWKDIDLDRDAYIMKCFPVSSLPNDPEGRLATIQEYIQAGMMSPRTGRKLLDFPDLEQVEDLQNAAEDYLNMILEKIVDDNEYTAPDPECDLQLGKELVLEYINQGKLNQLDDDRLEKLRLFNSQIDLLLAKAMPAPPPSAPMPGAGPGAGVTPQAQPMPTPQSNMVPNVAGVA